MLEKASTELVAVTAEHAIAARRAWCRFAKSNLPAALNFGDCFACALAETTGEPLLFKGSDFALTEVMAALPSRADDVATELIGDCVPRLYWPETTMVWPRRKNFRARFHSGRLILVSPLAAAS